MRNPTRSAFSLLALVVILIPISFAFAQQQNPSDAVRQSKEEDLIRFNTTLVTTPVSVLDRNGRFISNLKGEQFHIYEDGIEQQIAYFESVESPFTVALLLDTSDSTQIKLKDIQNAAIAFVGQLRPDDRVMVIAFDSGIEMLAEATSDHNILNEAIHRARTGGGTSVYDTIDVVVKRRLNNIRGRKAIVLFTDGVDTTSRNMTYESALYAAEELDAPVYAIQYNTYDALAGGQSMGLSQNRTPKGEPLNLAYERGNRYLRLLADRTAGRLLYAGTPKHLAESFTRIAAELRQQYSLGYYPKNHTSSREKRGLKVRVSVPNVVVRARKTYIYHWPTK
jgi:Ca-activated chloride channel family protein